VEANSPAWWNADDGWHLTYLALPPDGLVGGFAVFDVAVPAAGTAGEHRSLTEGMTVSPAGLAQVADGPVLALFADGLDTAIYRLDPAVLRFRRLSTMDGQVDSLTAGRSGTVVAALASTSYEPRNVHAGPPGGPLIRLSDTRPAEHEFVVYPREGHGFVERNHQLDLLRRTRAWFDRWLSEPPSA
jgi:hypothetical protein